MISVVIPAYNAARFIHTTLASVLAQSYSDYEIIVVDDGSTDNTGDIVKTYGNKVKYIYQSNAGDGPARNTGIRAASGEWIAFLDHDDEWLPEKLEHQVEFLNNHPDLCWCATGYYQKYGTRHAVIGNSPKIKELGKTGSLPYFTAVKIAGCQLTMTSTMLVRKKIFDEIGMFESGWLRVADADMWWRIAHKYSYIGYITDPLSILNLDLQSGLNLELVFKDARYKDARRLMVKHLLLAKQAGDEACFRPFALSYVKQILQTTLFNGFKEDARETIKLFGELLTWYERRGAYALTTIPALTSAGMRCISAIRHFLGLNKELSRRYSRSQLTSAQHDSK
jgi:glycosyltransferase involved in cell wall biosynthesis